MTPEELKAKKIEYNKRYYEKKKSLDPDYYKNNYKLFYEKNREKEIERKKIYQQKLKEKV